MRVFAFADLGAGLRAFYKGDYATALNELLPLAKQGTPEAQFKLGFMYSHGQGVPQDYQEAVKWYRLAADQGDSDAKNNLGLMYSDGRGVPQDYNEAIKWYRLAADRGDPDAQFNRFHCEIGDAVW
jgi:TPR repeat protein